MYVHVHVPPEPDANIARAPPGRRAGWLAAAPATPPTPPLPRQGLQMDVAAIKATVYQKTAAGPGWEGDGGRGREGGGGREAEGAGPGSNKPAAGGTRTGGGWRGRQREGTSQVLREQSRAPQQHWKRKGEARRVARQIESAPSILYDRQLRGAAPTNRRQQRRRRRRLSGRKGGVLPTRPEPEIKIPDRCASIRPWRVANPDTTPRRVQHLPSAPRASSRSSLCPARRSVCLSVRWCVLYVRLNVSSV